MKKFLLGISMFFGGIFTAGFLMLAYGGESPTSLLYENDLAVAFVFALVLISAGLLIAIIDALTN